MCSCLHIIVAFLLWHRSFMGWEDLDVVDPEAEAAKKGEKAGETGLLEQVRHGLRPCLRLQRCFSPA